MIIDIPWMPRLVPTASLGEAVAASAAEVTAGSDNAKFITPAALAPALPSYAAAIFANNFDFLLWDNFTRANTSGGSLGSPVIGSAWDLRSSYVASYPLPAATVGGITSNKFVSPEAAGSTVYAVQPLASTPKRIGLVGSWTAGSGSAGSSVVLGLSTDDNYLENMLHCYATRTFAVVQKRVSGGAFTTILQFDFPSTIPTDGSPLFFEIEISGDTVAGVVNHESMTEPMRRVITDADISTVVGPYAFWELSMSGATVAAIPALLSAWAYANRASVAPLNTRQNRVSQFVSPSSGATLTMVQNDLDGTLAMAAGGALDPITVNLPANTVSITGQRRTLASTTAVSNLTLQATGCTVLGNVTSLAAGAAVTYEKVGDTYWQRVA
jgi:hypothetical protein